VADGWDADKRQGRRWGFLSGFSIKWLCTGIVGGAVLCYAFVAANSAELGRQIAAGATALGEAQNRERAVKEQLTVVSGKLAATQSAIFELGKQLGESQQRVQALTKLIPAARTSINAVGAGISEALERTGSAGSVIDELTGLLQEIRDGLSAEPADRK